MDKQKAKRQQILNASIQVIAENGYYKSQVSKIAKAAGVADGTIYLYFNNKEDLLISLFEEIITTFVEETKRAMEDDNNVKEQLRTLIVHHFEHLGNRPQLALLTQLELRQSQAPLRGKISVILEPYLTLIEGIVNSGMETGEFRKHLDIKIARQMIFGTMDQIVTSWVMGDMRSALSDQADAVYNLLANALIHS